MLHLSVKKTDWKVAAMKSSHASTCTVRQWPCLQRLLWLDITYHHLAPGGCSYCQGRGRLWELYSSSCLAETLDTALCNIIRERWIWILMRNLWKACQNFGKARSLSYAEKLFWFMAKVLGFAIWKTSASNDDFLKSWWRSKCSNLYFPPLVLIYLCVADGAASAAVVERRCDWLTQT